VRDQSAVALCGDMRLVYRGAENCDHF